jgi:N-acetylneuraminate synthase
MKDFFCEHKQRGAFLNPYVIAEIGVNHEGNIDLAKQLIDEVVEAGGHAAKFQSYKAEKIASRHSPAYWDTSKEPTNSQFALFKKYDGFNADDYTVLAQHCAQRGIDFLSTPFDLEAVDYLAPLMPFFKIASADITNTPLIRKCASTGKRLIMSTGASTLAEIEHAVTIARRAGAQHIALLHCVLNYPTAKENAQMGMMEVLRRTFPDCYVGYSDHVVPDADMPALEMATLMGAVILEKHFTHNKKLPGNDHYHAMNKEDLTTFMKKLAHYAELYGMAGKNLEKEQLARLHARRSIVAAKNIKKGDIFTEKNLIAKRPAHGISPVHWDEVIGKRAYVNIEEDQPLQWNMVDATLS